MAVGYMFPSFEKAGHSLPTAAFFPHPGSIVPMKVSEVEFARLLSREEDILYLTHRNADADAIGSAFALCQAFGGTVGVTGDLSRTAQQLVGALGASLVMESSPECHDFVVVVDASTSTQLGDLCLFRYAVVDHHMDVGLIESAQFYIQQPAGSTAEIVWQILQKSGRSASLQAALGLAVGIISDTGRFKHGHAGSFRAMAEILEASGLDYGEALEVLSRMPDDISQRIAALKAASRARIYRQNDWVVVTTEVGAFEGPSAMALLELGADVAFAAGRHGRFTRASGRARYQATAAGIDLSEIMRSVAQSRGGDGGGHKGASALEVDWPVAELLGELRRGTLRRLEGLKRA